MPSALYRNTKKVAPGRRELDGFERVKSGDIVWPTRCTKMWRCTKAPVKFIQGGYDHLLLTQAFFFGKDLTSFRACEIVEYIVAEAAKVLPPGTIMQRKYSIWRKKLHLPEKTTRQPLPLP